MNKSVFIFLTGILFAVSASMAQTISKPNIIIIVADDLGWGDVGFHGSDIKTPNIDALAKQGVVLNRYYVSPVCSPTRAGLMTGRYPDRMGLRDNVIAPWLNFGINTTEHFLPKFLAKAGYKNRAAIGKWHLGHVKKKYLPLSRGFTHFYGHYNGAIDYFSHVREGELDWHDDWNTSYDKGYTTDLITHEAVQCIDRYKNEGSFLLYIAYNAPHGPLQAKEEDLKNYGFDPSKPLFGKGAKQTGRGNTRRQTYSAMVSCMDKGVGDILSSLKKNGLEQNTFVLFQSDNGADPNVGGNNGSLQGGKFQEWDGGVRVPSIIRWPQGFKGGRESEQLCGYIDWVPTLCVIAGVDTKFARPFDGINLLPSLISEKHIDRALFLGHGSLISGNWKLIKANNGNEKLEMAEDVLFNIAKDPDEKKDLRHTEPAKYKELLDQLASYETLRSAIVAPPYEEGRRRFKAPKEWNIKD